jgi:hypothetical protein
MPKFIVSMRRTGYAFRDIEVEAGDYNEAREKAYDEAGDYDYSEKDADYKVEYIHQKEEENESNS